MLEESQVGFGWDQAVSVDKDDKRESLDVRKPFDTYKVANYSEFGRKVVEWACNSETRPSTVEEFRRQAGGDIYIPKFVKTVEFAQGDEERLVVYLPPVYKLNDAEKRVARSRDAGDQTPSYPLPDFYASIISGSLSDFEEILYSRIGDYSVAGCH